MTAQRSRNDSVGTASAIQQALLLLRAGHRGPPTDVTAAAPTDAAYSCEASLCKGGAWQGQTACPSAPVWSMR
jgi:hypothetical protein